MSSTARGSTKRDRLDRYYTQQAQADCCVKLFADCYGGQLGSLGGPPHHLPRHPEGQPSWPLNILESGVGGGSFARPLKAKGAHVTGIDIDFMAAGFDDCDVAVVGSFIDYELEIKEDKKVVEVITGTEHDFGGGGFAFDAVVGNPPFIFAEAFINRGLEVAPIVAFLLRIAFVTGKGRYERLWSPGNVAGLRYFYPLAERGSFTADGKTDSADYAFFIIERGYTGDFSGRTVSWHP